VRFACARVCELACWRPLSVSASRCPQGILVAQFAPRLTMTQPVWLTKAGCHLSVMMGRHVTAVMTGRRTLVVMNPGIYPGVRTNTATNNTYIRDNPVEQPTYRFGFRGVRKLVFGAEVREFTYLSNQGEDSLRKRWDQESSRNSGSSVHLVPGQKRRGQESFIAVLFQDCQAQGLGGGASDERKIFSLPWVSIRGSILRVD
jgi:hypothetical protein